MSYNTTLFIFYFLPIVIILFYIIPVKARLAFLCLASFVFYGFADIIPLIFLVISIIWGYITAFLFFKYPNKKSLIIAISFPLLVLLLFKYLDFALCSISASRNTRDFFSFFLAVVLPAGVSFYTFQIISYSIDVADKKIMPEKNIIKLATYISFFPQLIAGPIVRYSLLKEQLDRLHERRKPDIINGVKLISIGLFAKVIIADNLGVNISRIFHPGAQDTAIIRNSLESLYVIFAYSFQIYYDFWAYSLIAIGLGKLFLLELPKNFDQPYLSRNPKEFWKRWHITLSYWIKDYVYIKLGGSHSYLRNIIIVFLICGIWHGAGWKFIYWGCYHAAFVLIYHKTKRKWDILPHYAQICLTFTIVSLGWGFFMFEWHEYIDLLNSVISLEFGSRTMPIRNFLYLGIIMFWHFYMQENKWLFTNKRTIFDNPIIHALLLFTSILFFRYSQTFIYFRF